MTRSEQAKAYFLEGYNCAQAIIKSFSDVVPSSEVLLEAVRPLGGGMGRLRQTCGSVSGAAVALGVLFPELSKGEMYALVQELARRFTAMNGSINCGELLTGVGLKVDTNPNPEARTPEYYKKRPCPDLIADAAGILEQLLLERNILQA